MAQYIEAIVSPFLALMRQRISVNALPAFATRTLRRLLHAPCMVCNRSVSGAELCPTCASTLNRTPWGVASLSLGSDSIPVLWREPYGGLLTEAVYRAKYHGDWGTARLLGGCLGRLPRPWLGHDPVVIPVPLSGKRLAGRGYNQSLVMARQAARLWRLDVKALWLDKTRDTARQATLAQSGREENLSGSVRGSKKLDNRRVILIDDIMTTGATLREAARAVGASGGHVIAAAVIAHVPRRSRPIPHARTPQPHV